MKKNEVNKPTGNSEGQAFEWLLQSWSKANRLDPAEAASVLKAIQLKDEQEPLSPDWWQDCLSAGLDKLSFVSKREWFVWTKPALSVLRQGF